MSFTDEYNKVSKLLKEIEKIDAEIDKLKRQYNIDINYLRKKFINNKSEYNRHYINLDAKRSRKINKLLSEKNYLLIEIDCSDLYTKSLFVRVGDLRDEIANYLKIDPKDVNLYARVITIFSPYSPGHHIIFQSMKDFRKNDDTTIKVLFRVRYDDSKNINYDIIDAFVYDLNNSMTQADGINLLDHMYKRMDDLDSKNPRYKDVALENDEVEDLYLKVPFQMLFDKETDKDFYDGKIVINPNPRTWNGEKSELYHYDIREHRMENDTQVETLNIFRTCVLNCLKKQDIKNKTLVKK